MNLPKLKNQREKDNRKKPNRVSETCETIPKLKNICNQNLRRRGGRENRVEEIFEQKIAWKLSKLMKDINSQFLKAQQTPRRINTKKIALK